MLRCYRLRGYNNHTTALATRHGTLCERYNVMVAYHERQRNTESKSTMRVSSTDAKDVLLRFLFERVGRRVFNATQTFRHVAESQVDVMMS